jgi:hypothetical protein
MEADVLHGVSPENLGDVVWKSEVSRYKHKYSLSKKNHETFSSRGALRKKHFEGTTFTFLLPVTTLYNLIIGKAMSAVSIAWTKIRSMNVLKFKLLPWSLYSNNTV